MKFKIIKIFAGPVISIILGIIFLPFMMCYKCCAKICCFCSKKSKYDHYEKNCDIFKIMVIVCVVMLSICVWTILSLWLIQMSNMVGSLTRIMCTSVGVFNSLTEGVSGTNLKFAGTGGNIYLLNNLKIDLENFEKTPQASKRMNQMHARNLNFEVSNFKNSVKNFYDMSKTAKFLSCKSGADAAKPADLVRSTFINSITETIQNTAAFKKRYSDLTLYGDSLGNLADAVVKYRTKDPTTLKSIFKAKLFAIIDTLVAKLTTIQASIKRVDTYFNKLIDYKKTRFNMILGFVSAVVSIAGVILFYWLFMIFTMKLKKCMFLNTLCKLIMVTKVCLGILISIVAISLILVTCIVFNGCWIYDKSFQDKNLAD